MTGVLSTLYTLTEHGMHLNRRILTCIVAALMVPTALDSAQQRTNSNQGKRPTRTAAPTRPPDDDPQSEAKVLLSSLFTKCGDGYYFYHYNWSYGLGAGNPIRVDEKPSYLTELRGVTYSLSPDKLTTADKLNGLEWMGALDIRCEAGREFRDSRWSAWRDGCGIWGFRIFIGLTKKTGESWKISHGRDLNIFGKDFPPQPKPKCDNLTAPFQ